MNIAIIAADEFIRDNVSAAILRVGSTEQITEFENWIDAARVHRSKKFNVFLFCSAEYSDHFIEWSSEIRESAPESAIILVSEYLDADQTIRAINQARFDWLLNWKFSDSEIGVALVEATDIIRARKEMREHRFSNDVVIMAGRAAIILDRNFHVVHANQKALEIFELGDPFVLTSTQQIVCKNSLDTSRFYDSLRQSLHRHLIERLPVYIRVPKDSQSGAVVAVSIPVSAELTNHYTYHVVFNDLECGGRVRANDYVDALGVTASEARLIAHLVEGLDLQECSEAMDLKTNTVRSYMKNIFEKTGASRQAEVVRIALNATL